MIFLGTVSAILANNRVQVDLAPDSSCGSCTSCKSGCAPQRVIVSTQHEYKIGDQLKLDMKSNYFFMAFLLVFILPIAVLMISISLLQKLGVNSKLALGCGVIFFLLSYVGAYAYDKRVQQTNLYRVIGE